MKPVETPVCCKKCGMLIGYRLYDQVLVINNLVINTISGACSNCGTVFYFSQNNEGLEVILKKIIDRRQAHDNAK